MWMINLEKFGHDKLYDTDPKFLGGGDDNHEIRQPRELVSKPGFQKKKKVPPPENRTGVAITEEGKAVGVSQHVAYCPHQQAIQ